MTPQQEKELLRTITLLIRKIDKIEELITPLAPAKDEFLDFKEAQAFLKFSRSKLRQLISDGGIPYNKVENRIRFSRNSLVKWISQ